MTPAQNLSKGACPEPVEGACPEPAEGACPEPVEGTELGSRHVIVVGHGYYDYAVETAILQAYRVEQIHAVDPTDPSFSDHLARA